MKSLQSIPISEIRIDSRHRSQMGDLDALAESMARLGLLQPIVVTRDHKLLAGLRRVKAAGKLNWKEINAVIAENLTEAIQHLQAERDENICREAFLPSEAIALGKALAPLEEADAQKRMLDGQRSGGRGKKKLSGNLPESLPRAKREASSRVAEAVGMGRKTYQKAAEVVQAAEDEPEKFGKLLEEMDRTRRVAGVHKKLKIRQQAARIASEPPPLPKGPFRVIVIDPPWTYESRAADSSHRSANPYPSMTVDEIKALTIPNLACNDAVLWLWTTNSHLPVSFGILEHWGFAYKTILTWMKNKMGTGDWLRGQTEHCLMAIRGKPTIVLTNQTTALLAEAGSHSEKPDKFYSLVEKLCPGSKLDYYARKQRAGWVCYGDES